MGKVFTSRLGIGTAMAAGALVVTQSGMAGADTQVERPDSFTSAFTVMATPDEIFNADGDQVPGEAGASGVFNFLINADEEIICYDITLKGVTPPYMSMAKTATHIHEAAPGVQGPPRISFPDPTGTGDELTSSGCVQGPFTTGIDGPNGEDHGAGFSLAQIEANPGAFYADTHTSEYVAGAVRGQLTQIPVGGVETGLGGQAGQGTPSMVLFGGLGAVVAIGAAAALWVRRFGSQ